MSHPKETAAHPAGENTAKLRLFSGKTLRIGAAASGAVLALGGILWYFLAPATQTPADRLADALGYIKDHEPLLAREAAKTLEDEKYQDEHFPGGVEYVLGMAAYQLASEGLPKSALPKDEESDGHGETHESDTHDAGHSEHSSADHQDDGHAAPKVTANQPAKADEHGAATPADSHDKQPDAHAKSSGGHGHGAAEAEPEPIVIDSKAEYATAVAYLKEALNRGVTAEYDTDCRFALGSSLYVLGEWSIAEPLLEECVVLDGFPQRTAAASMLADIQLEAGRTTRQVIARALAMNEIVLATSPTDSPEHTSAELRKVECLLVADQVAEAAQLLDELQHDGHDESPWTRVLRAQLLISQGRYVEAGSLLEPLHLDNTIDEAALRAATYLLGFASEQRAVQLQQLPDDVSRRMSAAAELADSRQRSREYYRRVIAKFEQSEEAVSAHVRLGVQYQAEGAHEKAIQSFGAALRSVTDVENYRNRWMTLEAFRDQIEAASATWVKDRRYAEAIAIAELMTPVFPRDQAYELSAKALRRWAESIDEVLANASASVRQERQPELERLYRDAGAAYAKVAAVRKDSPEYSETLWLSAELSRRGRDFDTALEQVTNFLKECPEPLRPVALARRGELLIDLDRVNDAEVDLKEVVKKFPTSSSAFAAQFALGRCRLELQDNSGAEKIWRGILESNQLTPAAVEWRDSLFSLARLQGETAAWISRKIERPTNTPEERAALWNEVATKVADSIHLFDEYISRYPQSNRISEAEYELGKALQLQGEWWRWQNQSAQTENTRTQTERQSNQAYERALAQFRRVSDRLTDAAKRDQLDPVLQTLLENTWFEIPHTLFGLRRFEEAISGYSAAVNRLPHDVRVLTAYVQMAQSYSLLDRPVEARSMLEQVKVILDQNQIPVTAFEASTTSLTRTEWQEWLDRARKVQR